MCCAQDVFRTAWAFTFLACNSSYRPHRVFLSDSSLNVGPDMQVHTSDLPLLFNMTKCLAVALVMSLIGALGSLLLLVGSLEFSTIECNVV